MRCVRFATLLHKLLRLSNLVGICFPPHFLTKRAWAKVLGHLRLVSRGSGKGRAVLLVLECVTANELTRLPRAQLHTAVLQLRTKVKEACRESKLSYLNFPNKEHFTLKEPPGW